RYRRLCNDHDLPCSLTDVQRAPHIHRRGHTHPVAPADRLYILAGLSINHGLRDTRRQTRRRDGPSVDRKFPISADIGRSSHLSKERYVTREDGGCKQDTSERLQSTSPVSAERSTAAGGDRSSRTTSPAHSSSQVAARRNTDKYGDERRGRDRPTC